LLLYGTGAVLVAALALRWPPLSWGPPRVLAVLRIYLPAALVWLLLVIGYLRAMHACGRQVAPQPELLQVAASGVATPGFWVAALVIVVAAPLAEEIVFRGYLLGFLLMVMPRWPAQLAAAAAFGWVHGIDYMLPIALLGLLFGWLRERYGAMWPSVVAHMLHNGLTLTLAVAWPRFLEQLFPR
jgi:membrane protease YdiL (CAAX protease family)